MKELSGKEAKRLISSLAEQSRRAQVSNIRFPVRFEWKFKTLKDVIFQDCEFKGTYISPGFRSRSVFENCSFKNVDFDGMSCWKVCFRNCLFKSVIFGKTAYGGFEKGTFESCEIANSTIEIFTFKETDFIGCNFRDLTTRKAQWEECKFENVRAYGNLSLVNFFDCSFIDVDFSLVHMVASSVLDSKVNDLKLPDRPDNFAITADLLVAAKSVLKEKVSGKNYEAYCEIADVRRESGSMKIIDGETFLRLDPSDRGIVLKTLYQMRHS